jgi:hypothetical protein
MKIFQLAQNQTQEKEEWIEQKIAYFIEDKFNQAIELFKKDLKSGSKQKFIQYLKQVWKENEGVSFMLPKNMFPKNISQYPIKMQYGDNEAYHENGTYVGMKLNPYGFDQITETNQINQIKSQLFQGVEHETEHIYNKGTSQEEGIEGSIKYLLNQGEMAAHARQLAYIYIQNYPQDTTVNRQKLNTILPTLKPNYDNYVNQFADPEKQAKYQQFGDLKTAHQQFMNSFNQYFTRYKAI